MGIYRATAAGQIGQITGRKIVTKIF